MLSFDRRQLLQLYEAATIPYARPGRSSGSLGQIPFPLILLINFLSQTR